jgi:prefoldin beta subunit
MAANLNAQLEAEAGDELQAYKILQGHVEQLHQSRGRFVQQRVENEAVRDELALDEGANVFKTVGPVLFRQDYDEVKENVQKRLEFIAAEVDKVDAQVKAKTEEQQKIGEIIMKKQQDLRQRAAEEAKKVYEEQMAKQE